MCIRDRGMDRLIRIFAAVHEKAPDWNLRIIGEGDERPALEALIREQGLSDCVTLTGKLSPEGVEREMLSASIYASTSKSDGFMPVSYTHLAVYKRQLRSYKDTLHGRSGET